MIGRHLTQLGRLGRRLLPELVRAEMHRRARKGWTREQAIAVAYSTARRLEDRVRRGVGRPRS